MLCREFLISPLGRRLRMEESEIKRHTSVDPTTLRTLVDHRLLRADQTPEGTYYELSHDSLINAVLGSSRWSFTFRAGLYLFAGALCLFFGFSFFSYIFIWPFVFWQSKHEWNDVLTLSVVVPFSGLVGWFMWRAGIRNLKKYRDMRHRSRLSRRAALPIEGAT
jgi:hypothetical protein